MALGLRLLTQTMKHFLSFLASIFQKLQISQRTRAVFGDIHWTQPEWLGRTRFPQDRRLFRWMVGSIILLVFFVAGMIAFLMPPAPDPDAVQVTIQTPSLGSITKQGIIPSPLEIDFSRSVAPLDQIGEEAKVAPQISPEVKGRWYWYDSSLCFQPEKDWPSGVTYYVKFPAGMTAPGVKLAQNTAHFTTLPFSASIEESKFYVNPKDPSVRQITATLVFSHPVEKAVLEKHVVLSGDGIEKYLKTEKGQPQFEVEMTDFGRKAFFRSASLRMPEANSYAWISVEKGLTPVAGDGLASAALKEVTIPDLMGLLKVVETNFSIIRTADGEPHQTLTFDLSIGVKPEKLQERLSVYLLPKDRPAEDGFDPIKNYAWHGPGEVNEVVLAASRKLDVHLNPSAIDYPELHSCVLDVPEDRFVYVRVEKGLVSLGGFIMRSEYGGVFATPRYPHEARLEHPGSVLALSGEKKLSVISRGIQHLQCRIARVSQEEIHHLVSQSGGNFEHPEFKNYSFGEDNIAQSFYKTIDIHSTAPGKPDYLALDLKDLLGDKGGEARGLFFLQLSEKQPEENQVRRRHLNQFDDDNLDRDQSRWDDQAGGRDEGSDQRFLLVTDLGLIVKENADETRDVFVQSIKNGRPVSDVKIEVLAKNGTAVATAETDENGHAPLPRVSDLRRDKTPVAILAQRGSDISFLPFHRRDRNLNMSRFETGGVELDNPAALSVFVFTDRGLYRPGDDVHFGVIARQYDWKGKLKDMPLKLIITNPQGQWVTEKDLKLPADGFVEARFTPREQAPTGTYTASVYLPEDDGKKTLLGSDTFRVEEFLPDRMKITSKLSRAVSDGWLVPGDLKMIVDLKNLYGVAATQRRVTGEFTLTPTSYHFARYPDYVFDDPDLQPDHPLKVHQETLPEALTDDQGEAMLDLGLDRFDRGVYQLSYLTRGFEAEGGRNVATGGSALVSPREYLVGYKPDGDLDYLRTGSRHMVQFLAVQSDLEPHEIDQLHLVLSEERHISVLTRQPNGNYAYQSEVKEQELNDDPLKISTTGYSAPLRTQEPGTYLLRVVDAGGARLSTVRYTVVGDANLSRSLEKNAELKLQLSKGEYKPGEEISMAITAPYTGAGLITIERDHVYANKWFRADTTSSTQTITLPKNLEGNAYVNVTFVRSLDSHEIFSSPLSYAAVPFRIDRSARTVKFDLQIPAKARPGRPFPIKFQSDRPCRAVIYAVDEGILQVAHYTLPDPLDQFLPKRALQVQTEQILDLILPEFSVARAVAAAGGGGGEDLLAANLNPFRRKAEKPVVFWSGIVECTGKEQTINYEVPDYFNGTLHVMAVAVSEDAIGSAEKKAILQNPLVIQPNVPTFVAPGDEFEVSVSVANLMDKSGPDAEITPSLTVSEGVEILEKPQSSVKIAEGHDATLLYRLKARDVLGNTDLVFAASSGSESVKYASTLSVRPASPFLDLIRSGYFDGGTKDIPVERDLYPQFRQQKVILSPLPLGLLWGLETYLYDYPHYCSEQLTSIAFAKLLEEKKDGKPIAREDRQKSLNEITSVLATRQNDKGAFGLWNTPGNIQFDFPSVYVMHLLTEARERGFDVPNDLYQRGLDHLREMSGATPSTLVGARQQAYAIYLLTRNQEVTTNDLDRVCKYLDSTYPDVWYDDVAALYCAGSYAMLKNRTDAEKLITRFQFKKHHKLDWDDFYSDLGRDSQYLYILSRHFPERIRQVSSQDLLQIVDSIMRGNFATHSSAYTILGLKAYAEALKLTSSASPQVEEKWADGSTRPLELIDRDGTAAGFHPDAKALRLKSNGAPRVFYQVIETGFDRHPPTTALNQGLEVYREYRNQKNEVADHATLGEELTVHIRIRSTNGDPIYNVAILDLLPGGFEVEADSIRNNSDQQPWNTIHTDHVDVREDRVVIYGTADDTAREFVYKIRATNRGTYLVPPVQAESMYRREVQGHGVGGTMCVEAAP